MALISGAPNTVNLGIPHRQFIPEAIPERQPGLMNMLAAGAGQGVGQGVQTAISDLMEQAALQKALSTFPQQGNLMEQLQAAVGQSPQARNFLLQNLVQPQQAALSEQAKHRRELEKVELQNLGKMQAAQVRGGKHAEVVSPEQKQAYQKTFNDIGDIYKSGKIGYAQSWLPRASFRKNAGKLRSLSIPLLSYARKLENAGHLTEDQFNYVKSSIPQPDDSLATFQGKMQGIASILGLDPGIFGEGQPQEGPSANQIIRNTKTGETAIWNGTRYQPYQGQYESNP